MVESLISHPSFMKIFLMYTEQAFFWYCSHYEITFNRLQLLSQILPGTSPTIKI